MEHFKEFLTKKHGRGKGHCLLSSLALFSWIFFTLFLLEMERISLAFLANAKRQDFKSFFSYS